MSGILPFADVYHPIWSPVANEIHAAIWDHAGLEIVQGFVRKWASAWVAKVSAAEAARQQKFAFARKALHFPDDKTLNLIADNLPDDWQLKEALWDPELPELPLPPSSHSPRSLAEKWAGLAAVHDVFDLSGDKVLPWPLPEDNQDLVALREWMRGEGGAYQVLLRKVSELPETVTYVAPIRRWLEDLRKGSGPAVETLEPRSEGEHLPPPIPKQHLTNWREILVALGMTNNDEDKQKVDRLNRRFNGPIVTPGQGAQPFAEKRRLLEWWNGLEKLVQDQADRSRDAKETVKDKYAYGRDGQVVPEISGQEKKRRKDRKP
ncbi:MAG: hypothetical protein R3C09_28525 [Pirellulaceae bacterium]